MNCAECNLWLSKTNVVEHFRRFHLGSLALNWSCALCPFSTHNASDVTAHAVLTAHYQAPLVGTPSATLLSFLHKSEAKEKSVPVENIAADSSEGFTLSQADQIKPESDAQAQEAYNNPTGTNPTNPKQPNRRKIDRNRTIQDDLESQQPAEEGDAAKVTCLQCSRPVGRWKERHIVCCLQIRPFACSECGYRGSVRSSLFRHIRTQAKCSGARIILPSKEEDEMAVIRGFATCFGITSPRWSGLTDA